MHSKPVLRLHAHRRRHDFTFYFLLTIYYLRSIISFWAAGGNPLNPIQSARLRTAETFNFKTGRVEVRAKLPRGICSREQSKRFLTPRLNFHFKGDWIWPAIWMLPRHQAYGKFFICLSRTLTLK